MAATHWTEREDILTLEKECFCTYNNGGMKDLMAEFEGTHERKEKEKIVEILAKRTYSYNKHHCASVYIEDFSMQDARDCAHQEFLRRAHLNWDDANTFDLHSEEAIDAVRFG